MRERCSSTFPDKNVFPRILDNVKSEFQSSHSSIQLLIAFICVHNPDRHYVWNSFIINLHCKKLIERKCGRKLIVLA